MGTQVCCLWHPDFVLTQAQTQSSGTGIRQGTSSGINLCRKSFCSSQFSSSQKKPTAKFLLTSKEAELSSGSRDRMKEIPCLLSYLKYQSLMVFRMHWAWSVCCSNSFEVCTMEVLSPYRRKMPVMVQNKEPEEPWRQQLCFPAQHAISETLEFLES